jgi:hypothetical protein
MADVNCELSGVWTGNEIGCAKQIEKLVMRQPTPPAHNLVFHHRDMRGRTTERSGTQSQKKQTQSPKGS